MKMLVTGARGMLGSDLMLAAAAEGMESIGYDKDELDITDENAVAHALDVLQPDVIFNAAAYNLVDNVEREEFYPIALAVNALAPGILAREAVARQIPFVHFSSDYVFAGDKPEGYAEDDEPRPISRYGETKRAGERAVEEAGGHFLICRTSKLFGAPSASPGAKPSFASLMLTLAKQKPSLDIVDEEVSCPTYTPHLAQASVRLFLSNAPSGYYHLVNAGPPVTWYQFAEEIFTIAGVQTPRRPVPASAFPPRPAARPKWAALLNTKSPPLPSRAEAIAAFLALCPPS